MYKELVGSVDGFTKPDHGNLTGWAKQGKEVITHEISLELQYHKRFLWKARNSTCCTFCAGLGAGVEVAPMNNQINTLDVESPVPAIIYFITVKHNQFHDLNRDCSENCNSFK